jgi:hypothetical protein
VTDAQGVMEDLWEHRRAEWEHQQEERQMRQPIGLTAAGIRLAFGLTQTGPEFAAAIEDRGLIFACMNEGDTERLNRWERQRLREEQVLQPPVKEGEKPRKKRDIDSYEKYQTGELVIVNQYGGVFQLTAATTGAHKAEREERLNEIDRAPLMNVTAAQTAMLHYQQHQRQEWLAERERQYEELQMRQPLSGTAAGIRLAYSLTQNGPDFAAAIEDRGLILAVTTEADAERLNRWERQRLRETRAGKIETETDQSRKERDLDSYSKYQAGELVIVNQYGGVFQLTAATTGAHTAEREARLNEIDRAPLMDVTAAQATMQQYQHHQRQEWRQQRQDNYRQSLNEKVSPISPPQPERQSAGLFAQAANETGDDRRTEDLRGAVAEVWERYRRAGNEYYFDNMHEAMARHAMKTGDRQAFSAALEERGITFARATKEEADHSHRQAAFAREIGNYAPRFKEGEIVIITEPGLEYRREGQIEEPRRVHKLDPDLARKFMETLGTADKLQGIEVTLKASDERAQQRREEREEARREREEARQERADYWSFVRNIGKERKRPVRAADAPARAAASAFSIGMDVAGLVFSLGTPKSPRAQAKENRENAKATARSNAETEFQIDVAQYAAAKAQEQANRDRQQQQEQAARDREREQQQEQERSRQR